MRPEWGEQNTTGVSCSSGRSNVNGGVSSARIEARSLACMTIRDASWSVAGITEAASRRFRRRRDLPVRGGHRIGNDFAKRARGLSMSGCRMPSAMDFRRRSAGHRAISLLVYQIGARFVGHRRGWP